MAIVLKGVSTPEDALLAYDAGVQGIVLSNHGGRQLDTSRSGLENLVDIVAALKTRGPWPNPKFSIFVDGGVRRASDVLKAIALGASAVGVGRGFLYSFSSYGQEGVERAIEILRVRVFKCNCSNFSYCIKQEEFQMNMRLIGARTISEIVPEMVDASALRMHVGVTPTDNLYNQTCEYSLLSAEPLLIIPMIIQTNPLASPLSGTRSCKMFGFQGFNESKAHSMLLRHCWPSFSCYIFTKSKLPSHHCRVHY